MRNEIVIVTLSRIKYVSSIAKFIFRLEHNLIITQTDFFNINKHYVRLRT